MVSDGSLEDGRGEGTSVRPTTRYEPAPKISRSQLILGSALPVSRHAPGRRSPRRMPTTGSAGRSCSTFLIRVYDVLGAFWVTVQLTFCSAIGSVIWGTLLAAMRVSPVPLMRGFGTAYVNIVRNIPLTVIIIVCSLGLNQTLRLSPSVRDRLQGHQDFRLAVLGLIVYTATVRLRGIAPASTPFRSARRRRPAPSG